jgi:hypothetical protein
MLGLVRKARPQRGFLIAVASTREREQSAWKRFGSPPRRKPRGRRADPDQVSFFAPRVSALQEASGRPGRLQPAFLAKRRNRDLLELLELGLEFRHILAGQVLAAELCS